MSLAHGTRTCYQLQACRCTPCRAANAAYIGTLRKRQLPPLGTLVSPQEARRHVQALLIERYTKRGLAPQLGLHRHTLSFTRGQSIRLKTLLKLRRAVRMLLHESES